MVFFLRHFRADVNGRTTHIRNLFIMRFDFCAKPKINQFGLLTLPIDKDIFKFQISMDDVHWVHIFNRFDYLEKYLLHFIFVDDSRAWEFPNILEQIIAIYILDDYWNFAATVYWVVYFHNTVVVEFAQNIDFFLKSLDSLVIRGQFWFIILFDCYLLFCIFLMCSLNDTEGSLPDQYQNFIVFQGGEICACQIQIQFVWRQPRRCYRTAKWRHTLLRIVTLNKTDAFYLSRRSSAIHVSLIWCLGYIWLLQSEFATCSWRTIISLWERWLVIFLDSETTNWFRKVLDRVLCEYDFLPWILCQAFFWLFKFQFYVLIYVWFCFWNLWFMLVMLCLFSILAVITRFFRIYFLQ